MSDFFNAPPPPREWECPRPVDPKAWAYRRRVEELLADPDAMRAFSARCRLLAEAGSSPAARCEEPSLTAGSRGSATVPGPA